MRSVFVGHLGSFLIWAIMNSATLNILVHNFRGIYVCISAGYTLGCGTGVTSIHLYVQL